jgi:hypothetical protein
MAPITTIIDIARPELEVFDYVIDPIRFIGRANGQRNVDVVFDGTGTHWGHPK